MLYEELAEVKRYVARAENDYKKIITSETGSELRDAWEDYLNNFQRSIHKMISYGKIDPNLRGWAHKLLNASTKDDEVLIYIRQARNSIEHGLEPFAEFTNASVNLNGLGYFENGNIFISNSVINNRAVQSLNVTIKDGKVKQRLGDESFPITESPASINLKSVYNEEKKETFPVPKITSEEGERSFTPSELSKLAMEKLKELMLEFENAQQK